MEQNPTAPAHAPKTLSVVLYGSALIAVAWRIGAVWHRHPAASDPEMVSWSLGGLGLWFLACAIWAYRRRPGPRTALFFAYGVLSAIHWGGPISITGNTDALLAAIYLVGSAIAAQCAFVHLAIIGATQHRPGRALLSLTYAPLTAGLILLALLMVLPPERVLTYIVMSVSVATVYGLGGAALWVYGWMTSPRQSPLRARRAIVAAALIGWIPPAMAMSGLIDWSGFEGLLNVSLAFEPAALAWFFTQDSR